MSDTLIVVLIYIFITVYKVCFSLDMPAPISTTTASRTSHAVLVHVVGRPTCMPMVGKLSTDWHFTPICMAKVCMTFFLAIA